MEQREGRQREALAQLLGELLPDARIAAILDKTLHVGLLLLARGAKKFEGTLDEARALLPARLVVTARSSLDGVPGVAECRAQGSPRAGWQDYALTLLPGASAGDLLEHCSSTGIALRRFEERRASLHDVFLHMVGTEESAK